MVFWVRDKELSIHSIAGNRNIMLASVFFVPEVQENLNVQWAGITDKKQCLGLYCPTIQRLLFVLEKGIIPALKAEGRSLLTQL